MIDENGYRNNVGIVIINKENKVFWGRRIGQKSWQFPQGGLNEDETPEQAMFRELQEETGLNKEHVEIIAETTEWLPYHLPKKFRRKTGNPICIGQRQKWFLLRLVAEDDAIDLLNSNKPEFDDFRWVSYWYPIRKVIYFKRSVYKKALNELAQSVDCLEISSKARYFKKKVIQFDEKNDLV